MKAAAFLAAAEQLPFATSPRHDPRRRARRGRASSRRREPWLRRPNRRGRCAERRGQARRGERRRRIARRVQALSSRSRLRALREAETIAAAAALGLDAAALHHLPAPARHGGAHERAGGGARPRGDRRQWRATAPLAPSASPGNTIPTATTQPRQPPSSMDTRDDTGRPWRYSPIRSGAGPCRPMPASESRQLACGWISPRHVESKKKGGGRASLADDRP